MEVDAEAGNIAACQSSRFTWKIKDFSRLNAEERYSGIFTAGHPRWRILVYPKGNNVDCLSLYLDVANSVSLPSRWSLFAQFSLSVVNQIDSKKSVRKYTAHQFNSGESDWGFTSFMPLQELCDPCRGFLVDDTLIVEAEITESRKQETGYVGLKNQKETSHVNSLLQTLYHIPYFRKAVYYIPTNVNDVPYKSVPLALQRLFYKLQCADCSVPTKEVTESFVWDQHDTSMQHNLHKFNRWLWENLKGEMKGTFVEGTVQRLFEGHYMGTVECVNVCHRSTKKESFYDIQLDVKGCRDVYASLDKFVEVRHLDGNNKYHAGRYGLQDARKGILFINFPPVLLLQLKRFEYDFMRGDMVKINDHYGFPLQLDLDRENGKYFSPEANKNVRNLYTLFSVLVNPGGIRDGHCVTYIRPTLSDPWYKFDGEMVTKEIAKRPLGEPHGGEEKPSQSNPTFSNAPFKFDKSSNAYMLVYMRDSDSNKIFCDVGKKDIPKHVRNKRKAKQEEEEHDKNSEADLFTIVKVARDIDLMEQIGKDMFFDLVDHDKVKTFLVHKNMPFNDFKGMASEQFQIPIPLMRFWLCRKRVNKTYLPYRPLTHSEGTQSVENLSCVQLRKSSHKLHNMDLNLFLEIEVGPDMRPVPLPSKTKDTILLFFKLYDPEKEMLLYVGRLFVKRAGKPLVILGKLNKMAGFSPSEDIKLYGEIKFDSIMCEPMDKELSFSASELEDGDIVFFQKSVPVAKYKQFRYPDIPSFLKYMHSRQLVHFHLLERPKEEDFSLEMAKMFTYDDVVERVARRLGLDDPLKIRLTSHNCYSQKPKPQPLKYRHVDHLLDMLSHDNEISDILYYEVLDIPLTELSLKTVKVEFHNATKDEVVLHNIRLPKYGTVGNIISDLETKVELSHSNAEIRLLEVMHHRIHKIFIPGEIIENINHQYSTLRAEKVPEEEKNLGANDHLIHVCHFTKDKSHNRLEVQNFGDPFLFLIRHGESLAEIKIRIQKKLQVPDAEFSKWKFAFLSVGCLKYLQDKDIVHNRFQRRDLCCPWELYLGLEHSDTVSKRTYFAC